MNVIFTNEERIVGGKGEARKMPFPEFFSPLQLQVQKCLFSVDKTLAENLVLRTGAPSTRKQASRPALTSTHNLLRVKLRVELHFNYPIYLFFVPKTETHLHYIRRHHHRPFSNLVLKKFFFKQIKCAINS